MAASVTPTLSEQRANLALLVASRELSPTAHARALLMIAHMDKIGGTTPTSLPAALPETPGPADPQPVAVVSGLPPSFVVPVLTPPNGAGITPVAQ